MLWVSGCSGDSVGNNPRSCPGSDVTTDSDGDGTPDRCDLCPNFDDSLDSDRDGTPDGCDVCASGADSVDADKDGVPDACDVCKAGADSIDADGDTVPDACDVCAGNDDRKDADHDGVPDGCDVCDVGADGIDKDGDGTPDACDACPADKPNDRNGDRVCDSVAAYDLATISEFTLPTPVLGISSFVRVVNTGLTTLDLGTAQVVSVVDNHPTANISYAIVSNSGTVPMGQAAGDLSPAATTKLVNSGLVNEPVANGVALIIQLSFSNNPTTDTNVILKVLVSINGQLVPLNYLIKFRVGGSTSFDSASRNSSMRSF